MSETTVTTTEQTTVVETIEQTVVVQAITPEGTELVETEQGTTVVEVRVQGPQGIAGPAGADGLAGENGLSAYEVALDNGFVGTEAEWLASLIGPQGPAGPEGDQGPPGADGANGSDATVNATNVASVVHAASAKSPPVDNDEFPIADSAASYGLKKVLWSAIKSALSATTAWLAPAALSQAGATTGQAMTWNGTAWAPSTIAATPAGSGAELQYRNSGAFGAAAVTHYDSTNGRLSIGAGTSPAGTLHVKPASASVVPSTIDGATSQTANLQDYRLANGNLLLSVVGKSAALGDCGIVGNTYFSIEPFLRAYAWWFQDATATRYAGFDTVYGYNKLTLASTTRLGWASSTDARAAGDTFLMRAAAAFLAPYGASLVGGGFELLEMSTPSAPASNRVRLYADDNGSGKTRVMALFSTGAAQQLAIEP